MFVLKREIQQSAIANKTDVERQEYKKQMTTQIKPCLLLNSKYSDVTLTFTNVQYWHASIMYSTVTAKPPYVLIPNITQRWLVFHHALGKDMLVSYYRKATFF